MHPVCRRQHSRADAATHSNNSRHHHHHHHRRRRCCPTLLVTAAALACLCRGTSAVDGRIEITDPHWHPAAPCTAVQGVPRRCDMYDSAQTNMYLKVVLATCPNSCSPWKTPPQCHPGTATATRVFGNCTLFGDDEEEGTESVDKVDLDWQIPSAHSSDCTGPDYYVEMLYKDSEGCMLTVELASAADNSSLSFAYNSPVSTMPDDLGGLHCEGVATAKLRDVLPCTAITSYISGNLTQMAFFQPTRQRILWHSETPGGSVDTWRWGEAADLHTYNFNYTVSAEPTDVLQLNYTFLSLDGVWTPGPPHVVTLRSGAVAPPALPPTAESTIECVEHDVDVGVTCVVESRDDAGVVALTRADFVVDIGYEGCDLNILMVNTTGPGPSSFTFNLRHKPNFTCYNEDTTLVLNVSVAGVPGLILSPSPEDPGEFTHAPYVVVLKGYATPPPPTPKPQPPTSLPTQPSPVPYPVTPAPSEDEDVSALPLVLIFAGFAVLLVVLYCLFVQCTRQKSDTNANVTTWCVLGEGGDVSAGPCDYTSPYIEEGPTHLASGRQYPGKEDVGDATPLETIVGGSDDGSTPRDGSPPPCVAVNSSGFPVGPQRPPSPPRARAPSASSTPAAAAANVWSASEQQQQQAPPLPEDGERAWTVKASDENAAGLFSRDWTVADEKATAAAEAEAEAEAARREWRLQNPTADDEAERAWATTAVDEAGVARDWTYREVAAEEGPSATTAVTAGTATAEAEAATLEEVVEVMEDEEVLEIAE